MADTGYISASGATDFGPTSVPWSGLSNITASDDSRAECSLNAGSIYTRSMLVSFDFSSVPSGSAIDGLFVEIEKSVSTTSGSPRDQGIYFSKDGTTSGSVGSNLSTNKATGTTWPTSDTYVSYGGSTDIWGFTTLTRTDLVSGTFTLVIEGRKNSGETSTTLRVDHVRIIVYYTESGGGATSLAAKSLSIPLSIAVR